VPEQPLLTPDGENSWLEFRRHIEWSNGFSLILLFCSHAGIVDLFCRRLTDICRMHVSHLEHIAPKSPETVAEEVLGRLRGQNRVLREMAAPICIELNRHGGEWDRARDNLLARLNEHRELLRNRWRRPTIIILPRGYRERVRLIAPDLWSVRAYSLEMGEKEIVMPAPEAAQPERSGVVETGLPVTDENIAEFPALREWQRLQARGASGPDVIRAGGRAFDETFKAGAWQNADDVANAVLVMARSLASSDGSELALRDISVSLDNVGRIDQALGRFEEARAAFAESLEIRRKILSRVGETPESLRDISVSLDNVGRIDQALGRFEDARAAFAESLSIARRLAHVFPDHKEHGEAVSMLEATLAELNKN
jgi:tetratricopeptide (TPR) repeat protein